MFYLLIGLFLLLLLVGLKHWFVETDPKKLWQQMRFSGLLIGIGLFLFLLVTGRLAWVWAAFAAMLPWISRLGIINGLLQALRIRKTSDETPRNTQQAMTRQKAAEVLGVSQQASEEEIRAAHKTLMKRNHPDHGGSPYLAQLLNQARDVMLNNG